MKAFPIAGLTQQTPALAEAAYTGPQPSCGLGAQSAASVINSGHAEPGPSFPPTDPVALPPVDQILMDISEYAANHSVDSGVAHDSAFDCLMEALAGGFRALRDPACLRLLGPVVPGATMIQGARVPGTSFELDPVMAAFNIGTLLCWERAPGPPTPVRPAADGMHPSDNLGGILAVGDYMARKAHNEGRKPPRVLDLLTALIKAHEIQALLALEPGRTGAPLDRILLVRVASSAVVVALLGGGRDQILNAVSHAWLDGPAPGAHANAVMWGSRKRWVAADATSRAVRLAFLALAGEKSHPPVLAAPGGGLQKAGFSATASFPARPYGSVMMETQRTGGTTVPTPWPSDMFAASVRDHFSATQAALIQSRCADRKRVMCMPVNEFAALLVKNG